MEYAIGLIILMFFVVLKELWFVWTPGIVVSAIVSWRYKRWWPFIYTVIATIIIMGTIAVLVATTVD